jgi:hypothetical protein
MGTGNKQRRFVDEAVQVLRNMGCSINEEPSNKIKVEIEFQGQKRAWIVSKTPKTTRSQHAAIGDLRRVLRSIGLPEVPGATSFSVSYLTQHSVLLEIIHDCLNHDQGFIDMNIKSIPAQAKALHPSLTPEDLDALAGLLAHLSGGESMSSTGNGPSGVRAMPVNWAEIVRGPPPNPPPPCQRYVWAFAAERKNWEHQGLTVKEALAGLVNYYAQCPKVVKLGVLVTRVWRPSELFKFQGDIEASRTRGICSLPLLRSGHGWFLLEWPWQ